MSKSALAYNCTMHRLANKWQRYAWIAILAILFNALAPIVSHARASAATAGAQVEVCTAAGMAMVAMATSAGDQPDPGPDHGMKGMNHCAYCATHAGSFGLPPYTTSVVAVLGGHDAYPALFFHAPYRLPVWLAAQPRGPPAAA